ncbi:hypothetical protein [Puerhibacterium puerhi]|uniref:hypothetical protein n=1 Tax=Puerhibacterium puerhi TaxID=2692623 RepID=UPI0013584E18|nr:hypothetical protein [Puerhibacterium puerhi]
MPHPRIFSPRTLASAAVGRLVHTTLDHHAATAYADARERGETVTLALHRARAEYVAGRVLDVAAPGDVADALDLSDVYAADVYTVNLAELARLWPLLDDQGGQVYTRDEAGALHRVRTPYPLDGRRVRLYVAVLPDDETTPDGEAYDADGDDDPRAAYDAGEWRFVGVAVAAVDWQGRCARAALWGLDQGRYWPGSDEAQILHVLGDLIGDVARRLDADAIPSEARATCGHCGSVWDAELMPTPAGRCPFEAEHEYPDEDARDHAETVPGAVGYVPMRDEDDDARPGITLTRDQLEAWAGRQLTDDEVSDLDDALPLSSLPEVVGTIAAGWEA